MKTWEIVYGQSKNNKARLQEPIDPDLPIDAHFKCVDDWFQYAGDSETPFTQKQSLQTFYFVTSETGLYTVACKTWRKRNENIKYLASLKTFFVDQNQEKMRKEHRNKYIERFDPNSHCWSHGYKVTKTQTCIDEKLGHQDGTARSNPMDGRTLNKNWTHLSQL